MKKSLKTKKIFNNLKFVTQQFMEGKRFKALSRLELMQALSIGDENKKVFKKVLNELTNENICSFQNGKYISKNKTLTSVDLNKTTFHQGKISLNPRGFGFVSLDDKNVSEKDIFIPKHLVKNAVNEDIVLVEIDLLSNSSKGPEGRVVEIVKRKHQKIVATVYKVNQNNIGYCFSQALGADHIITLNTVETHIKKGDRVVLDIIEWGDKYNETKTRLLKNLGNINDPSIDIVAAIEEYEIDKTFSSEALLEAKNFGSRVPVNEIKNRKDFRDLETFTIDPTTAKDFDDALSLSKNTKGNYKLAVHIADVSHYVKDGSSIDKEAKKRCNSTYFPGTCVPMLPATLSENLCSLKPLVNRLTASLLMEFDPQGTLLHYEIVKGVIKSNKRFTYKEAKQVLDGALKSPYKKTLELMVELCHLLKKNRSERGSLEFSIPEMRIVVNEQGDAEKTECIEYDITHQLVEEFMLITNEVVAKHLDKKKVHIPFRIHEKPTEDSLKDFIATACGFGFSIKKNPTQQDIQNLFDEASKTPYGNYLAMSYIRRMKLASYSPINTGHFGLCLSHYCHFTSPIRRYMDLVVHRALFETPMNFDDTHMYSVNCSTKERISERAERSVVLLKKLRLLKTINKQNPFKEFEAVITKVKNFGIIVEIQELMLEAFIHVSDLSQDFYEFDQTKGKLIGKHSNHSYL